MDVEVGSKVDDTVESRDVEGGSVEELENSEAEVIRV